MRRQQPVTYTLLVRISEERIDGGPVRLDETGWKMISSGTTPKIITRERYVRPVGYGAMCLESLVAIMAMIGACSLEPGVYLSMNVKGTGPAAAAISTLVVSCLYLIPPKWSAPARWRSR